MATKTVTTIPITNLELKGSRENCVDGSLAHAHNVRYNSEGVESLYGLKIEQEIDSESDFDLVYRHLDNYIAFHSNGTLCRVKIVDNQPIYIQTISSTVARSVKISHYYNVLFLTSDYSQEQYIFSDGKYLKFDISQLKIIDNPSILYEYLDINEIKSNTFVYSCNDDQSEEKKPYIEVLSTIKEGGFISGAFYFIIAYKLFDSTVIRNSPPFSVQTEVLDQSKAGSISYYNNYNTSVVTHNHSYFYNLSGCKPTITFDVNSDIINSGVVKSVVIFATRPQNIYDFEDFHNINRNLNNGVAEIENSTYLGSKFFAPEMNSLLSQPFYQIYEKNLAEIDDGSVSVTLNYQEHFEDIVTQQLYTPSFSVHKTIHKNMMEYNCRLHTFNQKVSLYSGSAPYRTSSELSYNNTTYLKANLEHGYSIELSYNIKVDNTTRELPPKVVTNYYYIEGDNKRYIPIENFYSYPDIRAVELNIYACCDNKRRLLKSLSLSNVDSNNFASYQDFENDAFAGFSMLEIPKFISLTYNVAASSKVSVEYIAKDTIMVSEPNNPFTFNPLNYYQLTGSQCEIYHIATAADSLSDTTFGKYPLIIFASEGILALEQGSGIVLYSNNVIIDSSPQLESIKATTQRGLIFFTSKEGLMVLSGKNVKRVSRAIEQNSAISSTDFGLVAIDNYILGSELYSNILYNEIIIYNQNYNYAYLYSIEKDSWSSRDMRLKSIGGNLFVENGKNVVTLNQYEDKSRVLFPKVVTNPIKLGGSNLKKVDFLSVHHSISENSNLKIALYGSNDLKKWREVGSSVMGRKIGRTSSSWRYYKLDMEVSSTLAEQFYLYLWLLEFKYTSRYYAIVE